MQCHFALIWGEKIETWASYFQLTKYSLFRVISRLGVERPWCKDLWITGIPNKIKTKLQKWSIFIFLEAAWSGMSSLKKTHTQQHTHPGPVYPLFYFWFCLEDGIVANSCRGKELALELSGLSCANNR